MRNAGNKQGYRRRILWMAAVIGFACGAASGAVSLIGVQYQQDDPFSEYQCYYNDKHYPTTCGAPLLGANVHVFIRNEGTSAVTLNDVEFAGYSLVYALRQKALGDHVCNSPWFRWLTPPQDFFDAGDPAWYKMDPASIPAGAVGQIIVRLRRIPDIPTLAVNVVTSSNTLNTTIAVDPEVPELASIGLSQDLTKVYLYWRRAGGAAPTTVMMDGADVTAITTTVGDASTNFAVSVISLSSAAAEMSYHVFQGIYSDGVTATAGVRTWRNPFIYNSWAAFETDDAAEAQAWISTCEDRGLNTLEMSSASNGLMNYLGTSGGRAYADDHNYGFVKDDNTWGTWSNNPRMWFLDDEPDNEEANLVNNDGFCGGSYQFPCQSNQAGVMGMTHIARGEELRNIKNRPTTLNVDGTWKPYGWYAYGQLSDSLEVNNYLQPHIRKAYDPGSDTDCALPATLPLYNNAMAVYATALAGTRAAEPNPFRQLLYSCEMNTSCELAQWDWAHPKCKRLEAYYALAAGAKGLGYWWFKAAPSASNGLSGQNLQAQDPALWEEIGLIGAETKLLGPYLVSSHPVDADVVGSTDVWVRALAWGTDSLILFIVNDNYWLDEDYHNTPNANATVTVGLPAWMVSSPMAFEVSRTGLSTVSASQNGSDLVLSLGTLDVAKIVFVTVDPQLRMTLQQRYDQHVWPGICNFAASICAQNTIAPSFVAHPSPQAALAGGSVTFTIVADGGSQMSYRWQKNGVDLSDGGHYSGCTTPFLTISSIDAGDVASYRCIVTNPYGSVTSNQAGLSIITVNITQHPTAQSICAGATAQFSVTASGQGTLSYQWQKDQVNLSNDGHYSGCTTATLTVSNADGSDVADYRCKVTDSTSSDYSDEAPLVLKTATSITQQPSDQGVEAGGTAVMSIAAAGEGAITYQWQKNQTNLTDGGHYSGCTTAVLTIWSVETNDEANYRCIATAGCGSATSNEAVLFIDWCAPYVSLLNGNFDTWSSGDVAPNWTGYSSGTSVFSKNTTIRHSAPNAQRIQPPSSGSGAYGGIYQNAGVNQGDAITVVAWTYNESPSTYITSRLGIQLDGSTTRPGGWQTNSDREVWTSLTVAGKASTANGVTIFLEAARGSSGMYYADFDDVTVYRAYVPAAPMVSNAGPTSLRVDTDPGCNWNNANAEYAITVGGGAYTLGTHWVQANGTVSTSTVWQTDAVWGNKTITGLATGITYTLKTKARYSSTCTQETNLGAGATGVPASTLVITQHPSSQNICPDATAVFSVAATGEGTLTYQWQKNGVNLNNGGHYSGCTTATLTVSPADGNDVADYRCVVTDANGSLDSNGAGLTLRAATVITGDPFDQSVPEGETAEFIVAATGDGTLSYQWQKNGANITDGGHYSGCTTAALTISPADGNDTASYRCVVTGGCGSATSSQATLTVIVGCTPPAGLLNADFDDYTTSWTVAPDWTSYSSGSAAFSKNTTTVHSAPNAQRIRPPTSGSGAYAGIYQNVGAELGDALTFVCWAYNESASSYITTKLGVQFDGSTTPPANWQTNSAKQAWTSLTLAGNATHATNGVTVFLQATRGTNGTYYADFDDVSLYYAFVPPAPAVTWASSTSLNVNPDPGCNSGNANAQYAITIGGGGYTLGTHWVQANGTVGTTAVWQTDATWAARTVTGLLTGTTYTFQVKARYSGTYTQASSLGPGANGTP